MQNHEILHFVEICLRRGMLSEGCYYANLIFDKGQFQVKKTFDKFIEFADENVGQADPYLLVFLLRMRDKLYSNNFSKKDWTCVVHTLLTSKVSRESFSLASLSAYILKLTEYKDAIENDGVDYFSDLLNYISNSRQNFISNKNSLLPSDKVETRTEVIQPHTKVELVCCALYLFFEYKGSDVVDKIFKILKKNQNPLYLDIIEARESALKLNGNICHLVSAIIITINQPLIYPVFKTPIHPLIKLKIPPLFMLDWNTSQGVQLGHGSEFYLNESLKMPTQDIYFEAFKQVVQNISFEDLELSDFETPEEFMKRALFSLSFVIKTSDENNDEIDKFLDI
ncbi:hypothetical protein OAG24_00670 [bacterium]|nr:hypothetical protein [bacterium]